MKKLFIISSILFFSIFSMAQEAKDSLSKKENKYSIGFFIAPNYSFYNYIGPNNNFSFNKTTWQIFPHGQTLYKPDEINDNKYYGKFNPLSFELIFKFEISKKIIFNSGVYFIQLGYLHQFKDIYDSTIIIKKQIVNYHFGFPILFSYKLTPKYYKNQIELTTGPIFYYQRSDRSFSLIQPFWDYQITINKKLNEHLDLNFGIDFKYSLTGTFYITRETFETYRLNTLNFFYTTSIPIGLIYHFK